MDKRRFNYLMSGDGRTFSTFKNMYKIIHQDVDALLNSFFLWVNFDTKDIMDNYERRDVWHKWQTETRDMVSLFKWFENQQIHLMSLRRLKYHNEKIILSFHPQLLTSWNQHRRLTRKSTTTVKHRPTIYEQNKARISGHEQLQHHHHKRHV